VAPKKNVTEAASDCCMVWPAGACHRRGKWWATWTAVCMGGTWNICFDNMNTEHTICVFPIFSRDLQIGRLRSNRNKYRIESKFRIRIRVESLIESAIIPPKASSTLATNCRRFGRL